MKTMKQPLTDNQEVMSQLKSQNSLVKNLERSMNELEPRETMNSLRDAAYDVRSELMESIREDLASDTDWYVNKLMGIVNAMAFIHDVRCVLDEHKMLNDISHIEN